MPRPPPVPYVENPGPEVDARCLAAARADDVLATLPAQARSFAVGRKAPSVLTMRRPGRALTQPEGALLWNLFSDTAFSRLHLSSGSSGLYGASPCEGVSRASCLRFAGWLCQGSLDVLAASLEDTLAAAGAADGELALELEVHEAGGPSCKDGPRCWPSPHYGAPPGRFHPNAPRRPTSPHGVGRCADDGDCEGPGNGCRAWYLRGGAEIAIYVRQPDPTWCGCVEGLCTWFRHP